MREIAFEKNLISPNHTDYT